MYDIYIYTCISNWREREGVKRNTKVLNTPTISENNVGFKSPAFTVCFENVKQHCINLVPKQNREKN